MNKAKINIISSEGNWLEGESIRQLEYTMTLPGMVRAVGLPDLHPGKGHPIGAVFANSSILYPYLIGNDIGCGMGFFGTSLKVRKTRPDKLAKRLNGIEVAVPLAEASSALSESGLSPSLGALSLGTIGAGNHFAEFQAFVSIENEDYFKSLNIPKDRLCLLIHCGSRGVGEAVLMRHIEKYRAKGLDTGTETAEKYLTDHNDALKWAALNRQIVANRMFEMARATGELILDAPHNLLTCEQIGSEKLWLHRKGATAISNGGAFVVPGSRGSLTYLVRATGDGAVNLNSIAHGAGRKWNRSQCKDRLSGFLDKASLSQTKLGSHVICEDKELLYQEAPQAYKKIDDVIASMVEVGIIEVIATLKPVVTYKVRKR